LDRVGTTTHTYQRFSGVIALLARAWNSTVSRIGSDVLRLTDIGHVPKLETADYFGVYGLVCAR
jgi:hypothetical protein